MDTKAPHLRFAMACDFQRFRVRVDVSISQLFEPKGASAGVWGGLTCALKPFLCQSSPSDLKTGSQCCFGPSRLRRVEASAGTQVLTVPALLCLLAHFLSLLLLVGEIDLRLKKKAKVLVFYHIGGLFVSSTPYISASFLKRGPQSFR